MKRLCIPIGLAVLLLGCRDGHRVDYSVAIQNDTPQMLKEVRLEFPNIWKFTFGVIGANGVEKAVTFDEKGQIVPSQIKVSWVNHLDEKKEASLDVPEELRNKVIRDSFLKIFVNNDGSVTLGVE